ncbi:MAG: hypothetical protein LBQ73_10465 [Tannerellaceae bacterium]|jgi:hypothetical protein|nr:hypothetical protein [Tannerellaceae bacterium]
MKRKTILAILSVLALLASFGTEAQNETRKSFKHAFAVQPLYWMNNGFRLDYERQLKNPRHWLQVSGIGYYTDNEYSLLSAWMLDSHSINEVWGSGLEVNYKWFPFKRVLYTSAGLSAAHFTVKYDETAMDYISYVRDGLTYYEPQWENFEASQYFNRLGTNFYIGVQTKPTIRFLIDGYMGVGWMHSFYNKDRYYPPNYINTLSYRGLTLTMGLRIGFRL